MKSFYKQLLSLVVILLFALPVTGCNFNDTSTGSYQISSTDSDSYSIVEEDGTYTSEEDVMNYLIEYDTLPDNFITKKEARELGWNGGSLEPYAPGKCIGGDRFGNYEGLLPDDEDIIYYECDIDTLGEDSRGAKRIVYSNEGDIYYTEDHYESFTMIYDEP